jgi:hypothetical protein
MRISDENHLAYRKPYYQNGKLKRKFQAKGQCRCKKMS